MKICPFCASDNIFFSKKRKKYFCEDCEQGFDTPGTSGGMRVFLSYGHDKNAEVVRKIKNHLTEKGYDVWIDTSEIAAGKDWRERITNGLIGSNGVIAFLSKHSVRDPGVCLDELRIAVCLKRAYIQTVLLEHEQEVSPPAMVRNTQWIDMSDWDHVSEEEWDTYFLEKMDLLVDVLNSDNAQAFNEELDFLSNQLNVSDNRGKEQRLLKQIFVGRKWLTEKVDGWFRESSRGSFMLYGVPGSGKSAFCANLTQFNPDVLATMFFEWDHGEYRTVNSVIKVLAFRLAATLPDYRRILCNLYKTEKTKLEQYQGPALFDLIILNPLQYCIDGDRGKGMIVFDGLDETTAEIADLLIHKASQLPEWIKVLFTSRYDPNTSPRFDSDNTVLLDQAQEQNGDDLVEYLAYRLDLSMECDTVRKIARKCEGSFMYAVAFCDAVCSGSMSVDEVNVLPSGLNSFYYSFFGRIFETRAHFLSIRPFLELLCVDEDVPEEVVMECLDLDRYGLWELRLDVKSLVTNGESACGGWNGYKLKTIQFVHQSIKDWLTAPASAGEYYVDVAGGYRRLARYAEACATRKKTETAALPKYSNALYEMLQGLSPNGVSEEQLKQLQKEQEARKAEYLEHQKKLLHDRALKEFSENQYIKWLILGEEYDKAKEILMNSFDPEEMKRTRSSQDYTAYYRFVSLWKWVDLFPATYPVQDLAEQLVNIVLFPKQYLVSRYAHRGMQISLFLLQQIMDSGRFRGALYALMESISLAAYFTSRASDDGETRDGWDKYYMARDAAICLKKLDRAGVAVPDEVRDACEKMKLTYNYYLGDPMGGMFYGGSGGNWMYGILSEPELYKDLCIVKNGGGEVGFGDLKSLQVYYNTTSLRYYLANSDEEDLELIHRCVEYHADLPEACRKALADIQNKTGYAGSLEGKLKSSQTRIGFIHSLLN